ncbi:MAG: EamA family transporter [Pseudomonadota bacterium]
MTIKIFFLIISCVTLSALSQIIMKHGMSSSQIQSSLANGLGMGTAWDVATNLYVFLGLSMYVMGAGLWLVVLSKVDVSMAYPFVGLGFVMTMLLGWLLLQENIGMIRIIGTLLIVAGVVLVSRS